MTKELGCSMEEQVVSRAHRMGATRPVLVETLAMRGTIEQQMLEYLQVFLDCPLCHGNCIFIDIPCNVKLLLLRE